MFEEELKMFGPFHDLETLSLRLNNWCMDLKKFNPVAWFLQNSPNLNMFNLYFPRKQSELIKIDKYLFGVLPVCSELRRSEQRTVSDEIA